MDLIIIYNVNNVNINCRIHEWLGYAAFTAYIGRMPLIYI